MIVIGASLGGLKAIKTLVSGLPADFRSTVAIVLHRAKDTPDLLAGILQATSKLPVRETLDKDPIETGHVYLAPADYHLLIDHGLFSLSTDMPVNFARPAIDVLFESAADVLGPSVLAVVLTGSSADGALGAAAVAARGGTVLVQDPRTAEGTTMPSTTLAKVPQAEVLPVESMPLRLIQWVNARK